MAVEATVSMVKKKLKDLDRLHNYKFLHPKLKPKVDEAVRKLRSIVSMLRSAGYRQETSPIKEWATEILRAVYNIEDSIDTFVLSTTSSKLQRRKNLWVPDVVPKEIRFLKEIQKFMKEVDYCNTHEGYSRLLSIHLHTDHENRDWQEIYDYFKQCSEIVGRKETINVVMNLLKEEDEGRRIIRLSYGEGTGKSALVRFIYNQVDIKREFEWRAWVRVSRKSEYREVLIDLWKQITLRTTPSEESHKYLKEKELIEKIKDFLKDKKYLIILDEIGGKRILDTLLGILPESLKGSRVIFTATKDEFPIDQLKGEQEKRVVTISELNDDNCYDLFKEKVQKKQGPVLVDPRLIKGKTGGFPLAIVLLAGVLSYTEARMWSNVMQLEYDYNSTLSIDKIKLRNIVLMSYDQLPKPLKPLFLYLGLFPKSFEIPVRRLLLLWIAEGLLPSGGGEPEKQARASFMELVHRNMIEVAKWSSDGSPKTCQIPGMLYDFFSQKSLHLGIFHVHKHSDGGGDDRQLLKARRLVEYYDVENYPSTELYTPYLRSYISFDIRHHDVPNQEIGKFLSKMVVKRGFGLLRLLDLEGVFKPILPETIGKMPHLKYVGLRWTFLDSLPSSLGNLPSLEALDIKHTNIPTLPTSIWNAEKLRHLYMNHIYLDKPMPKLSRQSLIQLKTLSGLVLANKSPLMDGLNRLTGLWKLGITYHSIPDVEKEMFNWISNLYHLESLKLRSIDESGESSELNLNPMRMLRSMTKLYLSGSLPATYIKDNALPQRIKALTLSFSGLKEDPMPTLGKLPGLKILKLLAKSYLGSRLTFKSRSFPELRVLKLWMLKELEAWSVEEYAMHIYYNLTYTKV